MLSPACEDCQALGVVGGDRMLGECNGAIVVAEGANTDKGLGEYWYDVARAGGISQKLREI